MNAGAAVLFVLFAVLAVGSVAEEVQRTVASRDGIRHAAGAAAGHLAHRVRGHRAPRLGRAGGADSQLLLGGAVTGVIVGIAAQQSLGNVFAGLVLILSRPFDVGDLIAVRSGALGGQLEGRVVEMGLVYVTLDSDDVPAPEPTDSTGSDDDWA